MPQWYDMKNRSVLFNYISRNNSIAYAGNADLMPNQPSNQSCETDGRVKGLKLSQSEGTLDSKVKHNTVNGMAKFLLQFVFCFSILFVTLSDPEQLDRLKAHSPVDELDLFRVSNSPLMSPYLASDAALRKLPRISLLVCFHLSMLNYAKELFFYEIASLVGGIRPVFG